MSYNLATIRSNELMSDGSTRLVVEFAGDAGEPLRSRPFAVSGSSTMLQLRQWVQTQLDDLNLGRTVSVTAALQIGQTINPAAATAPPAQTLEQVWVEKAKRLVRAAALELTNATAVADIAALRSDVNASYLTAYITKV